MFHWIILYQVLIYVIHTLLYSEGKIVILTLFRAPELLLWCLLFYFRGSREWEGRGIKIVKDIFLWFCQCVLDSIFDACYSWWQWLWFEHKPLIMQWFKIYVYCNRRDKHWGQDVQVNKNLPLKKLWTLKFIVFVCALYKVYSPPNKNSHKNEGKK